MPGTSPDYLALLGALTGHCVDFIVVDGVCAVLHGAPVASFDLDVVHSRTPENVSKLHSALEALDASSRAHPDRRLRPEPSHLASSGHQLLMTRFGPLDLLGAVGAGRSFEDLLPETEEMQLTPDLMIRVLKLESLIRLKEQMSHEKDLAALPLLRRTLAEKKRS